MEQEDEEDRRGRRQIGLKKGRKASARSRRLMMTHVKLILCAHRNGADRVSLWPETDVSYQLRGQLRVTHRLR